MSSSKVWLGMVVAAVAMTFSSPGLAYQWFVDTTTDGVDVAGCSLREAVAAAALNTDHKGCTRIGSAGNNLVGVKAGTYQLNSRLVVRSHVTIVGEVIGGVIATSIVGGAGSTKGFRVSAASNGNPSSVYFRHLKLLDFSTTDGSAIIVDGQQHATIDRCLLRGNSGALNLGGAIYVGNSAGLYVVGSWFDNNRASRAGAIRSLPGSYLEIYTTVFSRNEANQEAGAIWAEGSVTLQQSTFAQNVAGRDGGALYLSAHAAAYIYSSTFKDNRAVSKGTTFFVDGAIGSRTAYLGIGHSAVAQNTAQPDCASASAFAITSYGYNVVQQVSGLCSVATSTGDQLNVVPTLHTYGSISGGAPVNALGYQSKRPGECGNLVDRAPSLLGPTDGLGYTRVVDLGFCGNAGAGKTQDIGASEFQSSWSF